MNHPGPLPGPRTRTPRPPTKQQRGETLGDLEPVYDLFVFTIEFTMSEAVTHASGIVVKQVVVLTVNHRGPLPLRELHPTDETTVWRYPEGSSARLRPVYHYQ